MTASHPDGVTLSDYADDALPEDARLDVRAHLASCAECGLLVEGFREVQSAARRLPPLEPRREAWDRIERSLQMRGAWRRGWQWLAVAAAVVLAVFIGLIGARPRSRPVPQAAADSLEAPTAQSIEAELRQAEEHYQKAIAGLETIANAEKGALDPQTAATLEKNLSVVDQAISESRAALRTQPASEPAQASLLENFKAKIALLQDTVSLINEMRKGPTLNQKGT